MVRELHRCALARGRALSAERASRDAENDRRDEDHPNPPPETAFLTEQVAGRRPSGEASVLRTYVSETRGRGRRHATCQGRRHLITEISGWVASRVGVKT